MEAPLARHHATAAAGARTHRVRRLEAFGSVVRGDGDASSDIDLLVDVVLGGSG